jgi:hypothetical protein
MRVGVRLGGLKTEAPGPKSLLFDLFNFADDGF